MTAFFRQTWIVFSRQLRIALRNPAWVIIGLVQPVLYLSLFGPLLETVVAAILNFPGWAVIGVPGILLAWAGRSRRERMFVRHDQI